MVRGNAAPAVESRVLDFDKDGWMDLAFTHWGSPALTVWRNKEGKTFEPIAVARYELGPRLGSCIT